MATRPTFDEWMAKVHQKLYHTRAFECVANGDVLRVWYEAKFSPTRIARELNRRWLVRRAGEVITPGEPAGGTRPTE